MANKYFTKTELVWIEHALAFYADSCEKESKEWEKDSNLHALALHGVETRRDLAQKVLDIQNSDQKTIKIL